MTDDQLEAIEQKVNFSGYDRTDGRKIINQLIHEIRRLKNPSLHVVSASGTCGCGLGSLGETVACENHGGPKNCT